MPRCWPSPRASPHASCERQKKRARLASAAERYREGVRQLIDEAKSAALIRADIDTHLLMLALDGMTGWAYFWYREEGALRPGQIGDAFWDMLVRGVGNPPA